MATDNYARKRLTEELLRQRERDLNEQKEKYEEKISKLKSKEKPMKENKKSRIEKFSRSFIRQRLRQLQYARQIKQPLLSRKENLRALRLRLAIAKAQARNNAVNQQRLLQNSVGWEAHFVAPALEREVNSGFGSGVAWEGSQQARRVGREAFGFSSFSLPPHSQSVSRETLAHSKNVDFPSFILGLDVRRLSNILP